MKLICSTCKQEKDENEFSFKIKTLGIRQSKCKECKKDYSKQHYQDNKESYAQTTRKNRPAIKDRNKAFILDYLKKHPCVDCGEKDINVLEFDHKSMIGSKGKRVGEFIDGSIEALEREIAKCDVRCSNCHTRRTRKQLGIERTI